MKTQRHKLAIIIGMTIGMILVLSSWRIIETNNAEAAQGVINDRSNTVYSLQHPEILGTNENGEVVKRYHDYTGRYGATIYEVGKTKTEVTHRGKFGTTTDVSVEQE